jgi:choline kinase
VEAVILVAGRATRLRPITDAIPKCLLPVGGVPILERSIAALAAAGVGGFVLVTGYRDAQVRDAVSARFPELRVRFVHNERWDTANNCHSLLVGARGLDAFLALDGDLVFEPAVARAIVAGDGDACAIRRAPDLGAEEMKAEVDERGLVRAVSKELPLGRAAGEAVGLWRFGSGARAVSAILHDRVIARGLVGEYYEASFQEAIDRGLVVRALDVTEHFVAEIDTPADLENVDRAVASRGI